MGMSLVPERRQIFTTLSVIDNLRLGAYHRLKTDGRSVEGDISRMFEQFPILSQRRSQAGGTLSGGEQQRLCIARAIVNRPTILLADEPTGNLDTEYSSEIMNIFKSFHQVGVTLLISTHDESILRRFPARALHLKHGELQK